MECALDEKLESLHNIDPWCPRGLGLPGIPAPLSPNVACKSPYICRKKGGFKGLIFMKQMLCFKCNNLSNN